MYLIIRYSKKNGTVKEAGIHPEQISISVNHLIILGLVGIAFAFMIYGLLVLEWGFNEMSTEFFVMGIMAGLIGKLGINGTARAYVAGFKEMTYAAILVGLARSVYLVLQDGMIIDTIVQGLFTPLQYVPTQISAVAMMVAHAMLHIPIPSVSGQAALTIPLLTPLSDLIGMSRQVMILAYQYGAGMTDLFTPTNGALMAILASAKIPYNHWFAFAFRKFLVILAIGAISVLVAILIGI